MTRIRWSLSTIACLLIAACSSSDAPPPAPPGSPAAPTNLTVTLEGRIGARLAWTDNSDNETGFQIKRWVTDGVWHDHALLPPDTTTFEEVLSYSTAYGYAVAAVNANGESHWTNGVGLSTQPPPSGGYRTCLLAYESSGAQESVSAPIDTVWLCAEDAAGPRITDTWSPGAESGAAGALSAGDLGDLEVDLEKLATPRGFRLTMRLTARIGSSMAPGDIGEICFVLYLDESRAFEQFFAQGGVGTMPRQALPFGGPMPIVSGQDYQVEFDVNLDAGTFDVAVDSWPVARAAQIDAVIVTSAIYAR